MTDSLQIIPSKQITRGKKLGEGGFGIVFQGTWNYHQVAIKTLRLAKLTKELDEEFTREATIMTKLNNPCIVRLYGISKDSDAYAMVMEFMPGGDLYHLLADKDKLLPWQPLRWQIAIDIGAGLSYLHERKILHRDLKSLNVLLDKEHRAKITDFGLSKLKTQTSSIYTKSSAGSVPWMAPELFARRVQLTPAADVYAYGMVLWEIAARKIPFSDAHNAQLIPSWIKEGEREDIPKGCPQAFAQVIKDCWKASPTDRPTAKAVLDALHQAHSRQNNSLAVKKLIREAHEVGELGRLLKNELIGMNKSMMPLKKVEVSYTCVKTLTGHTGPVNALEILSNGCLASASSDHTIRIWDLAKGYQCVAILKGHTQVVKTLRALPNGCLASGSADNTVRIWDPKKGYRRTHTLKGHSKMVVGLEVLPNGLLASGSIDRVIKIWDLKQSYRKLTTLQRPWGEAGPLQLLANGDLAVVGGQQFDTIQILSSRNTQKNYQFKLVKKVKGHEVWVGVLQLLPNGCLASGSRDQTVKIWDPQKNYACIQTLSEQAEVFSLEVLAKDFLVIGGWKTVKIRDLKNHYNPIKTFEAHNHSVTALKALPNGYLATASKDKTIKIWKIGIKKK